MGLTLLLQFIILQLTFGTLAKRFNRGHAASVVGVGNMHDGLYMAEVSLSGG